MNTTTPHTVDLTDLMMREVIIPLVLCIGLYGLLNYGFFGVPQQSEASREAQPVAADADAGAGGLEDPEGFLPQTHLRLTATGLPDNRTFDRFAEHEKTICPQRSTATSERLRPLVW